MKISVLSSAALVWMFDVRYLECSANGAPSSDPALCGNPRSVGHGVDSACLRQVGEFHIFCRWSWHVWFESLAENSVVLILLLCCPDFVRWMDVLTYNIKSNQMEKNSGNGACSKVCSPVAYLGGGHWAMAPCG